MKNKTKKKYICICTHSQPPSPSPSVTTKLSPGAIIKNFFKFVFIYPTKVLRFDMIFAYLPAEESFLFILLFCFLLLFFIIVFCFCFCFLLIFSFVLLSLILMLIFVCVSLFSSVSPGFVLLFPFNLEFILLLFFRTHAARLVGKSIIVHDLNS